jgi:hypothetical protein
VDLEITKYLGIGATWKYYIKEGGNFYDVTPLRVTTSAGDVTFSASNGDATITVTDTSHGAVVNDFVTFSGAATLGGNITASVSQPCKALHVPKKAFKLSLRHPPIFCGLPALNLTRLALNHPPSLS